ncbi:helix-turn-helix transcriptional regulator [Caproiciproducens galactitolivorans]|uniref:Helix-turn-helix protein n=1 Tax=Caproiciproducens galactitolivorans TaxID=642589 RepID=A0A4Z0YBW8_9FIRM|nr:helix-turn-helix transcriptional regulator [Caproiciproducens galactitolivorans]NLH02494.1 helix-turn-helix transcriptional regulator [Clostridiales bacterium]QEY33713.1 helix-turn-helix transcriptional regulator [Caproiciproducens galactitolivorans]TGJ75336.1 helix-turn-helix protein [Caproiciproducens galactitolivorans]
MPANWTAQLIAKLHLNRISKKQLAEQLGYTPEYVSMVLNGHRNPNGAEAEFSKALDELIQKKQNGGT